MDETLKNGQQNGGETGWEGVADMAEARNPMAERIIAEYDKKVEVRDNLIAELKEQVRESEEKLNQVRAEANPEDKSALRKVGLAEARFFRKKSNLERQESIRSFMRKPEASDIEYRLRQRKEFADKVSEALPEDSDLVFHGTSIMGAQGIISSGSISSSMDRLGYSTSYDVEDQVSVTTRKNLAVTVEGYAGLTDMEVPAGCIFVMKPADAGEMESAKTSMLIGNVDFRENPERLVSVITTPENIERVEGWMQESELPEGKVVDYDGFLS